jgi:2-phospho-L-lactate guanylyltransferase
MLDDVLGALSDAGVKDLRILAGNPAAITAATSRGLPVLVDPPAPRTSVAPVTDAGDHRLRAAVDGALTRVPLSVSCLIVAADLPRLCGSELEQVLAHPAQVVVVPTAGGGTAILRLAAGARIPARYGPGSADEHVRAAEHTALTVAVLDLPGGRYDVDAVTDLAALSSPLDGSSPGPATSAFLTDVRG